MALWTRARFGAPAALLAIALYAFDPTVTAHGHYVKNDVPVALGGFLSCIAFAAYLRRSTLPRLLLAALALGLAIATKFTALLLLPMIALLYAVWRAQGHKPVSRVQGVPALAALLMLSGGVVFLIYAIPAFLTARARAWAAQFQRIPLSKDCSYCGSSIPWAILHIFWERCAPTAGGIIFPSPSP